MSCGCGCNSCGGAKRPDWLPATGGEQRYAGQVAAPVPFMAGDDDPESLTPEGTSPPISLPGMPTLPGSLSAVPECWWWAGGGLLLGYLIGGRG